MDEEEDEDGLKPLTVFSEDGRVLYDSRLARLVLESAGDHMRDWLVRSRLDALREGEGLSQRDLAMKVDAALEVRPLKNGNPRSYRAINEYFSGSRMRGGMAAAYLGAMETILLGEVAEYFGDAVGAQEALRGDLRQVEVIGELLHRVDEITAGYMMAGSRDGELAKFYGGPLTDDYESIRRTGAAMADRTTRSLVGIYVHQASSSAWEQGLRDQFLLHQACFGLFRALVRRVAARPGPRDRTCAEEAGDRLLHWIAGYRPAFEKRGRDVDPIDGPRPGIRIDPFQAYPSWRRFAYSTRVSEKSYTEILYSKVEKTGADEDLASAHTIQAVREATETVSHTILRRIAKYALDAEDWRRIPLSDEAKKAVTADHLERHLPGLKSLRCDGDAIRAMFGDGCEAGIGPSQLEHRRKFIADDPAGFRKAERAVQKAWEEAVDLAEARLRELGVSGDGAIMAFLSSAIAAELYGSVDDLRFTIVTPDHGTFDGYDTNVADRAFQMLKFFVNYVDSEIESEDAGVSP